MTRAEGPALGRLVITNSSSGNRESCCGGSAAADGTYLPPEAPVAAVDCPHHNGFDCGRSGGNGGGGGGGVSSAGGVSSDDDGVEARLAEIRSRNCEDDGRPDGIDLLSRGCCAPATAGAVGAWACAAPAGAPRSRAAE
ncbi:hypothetical protein Rsub_04975 [Raphidocelis subcapitata]|uniref:Uncharacterized protein n=1 Tax=Raphidocelis subcapitata TaxID=307507 RepID=A0A2V0P200_9CHLO|nr:hypothetical protein Rsub_04975 [Raphidocelis subcapitata]|eukprot:GBF91870.1 hypothetical protein Rsub_04975 [Raphidocelis subcapitata]